MSDLLEYSNLLRTVQDPAAQAVRDYLATHRNNPVLLRQAEKLNALFLLQSSLVQTPGVKPSDRERSDEVVLAESYG